MMKPYYTDPLAAAWMAKHHGMMFLSKWKSLNERHEAPDDAADHEEDTAYEADCGWGKAKERKYYIHPESLHLLEPQLTDIVHAEYEPQAADEVCGHRDFVKWSQYFADEWVLLQIIQRNGISFMWPEFEKLENALPRLEI
jgi:hypothetical protein